MCDIFCGVVVITVPSPKSQRIESVLDVVGEKSIVFCNVQYTPPLYCTLTVETGFMVTTIILLALERGPVHNCVVTILLNKVATKSEVSGFRSFPVALFMEDHVLPLSLLFCH